MKHTVFHAILLVGLPSMVLAQVDTSFTYQGELTVEGLPAVGEFDLEACVYAVPAAGVPLACSAPVDDLPVTDGRFTIVLDVGALFDGSERYLELRVREGHETTPHVPLQPRQALRSTPQAQYAARAPFTGLAGVPESLLDGDDAGVTRLVAGAGLTGGTITSSGTLAIAPAGVTGAMLAPNAVGRAQVDPAQVQLRISGQCAAGEYFRGFASDGATQCALLPVVFDRIIDADLDVGRHLKLLLRADGRPLLAYHEESLGSVRLYDCADAVCSNGTLRTIATQGDAGEGIAMALRADGRPLIAYIDAATDTLHAYSCSDAECNGGTSTELVPQILPARLDLALRADDRAVIVYRSRATLSMQTWHCGNADCTAGTTREHGIDPVGVAIVIRADGRPLLAGGGNANGDPPRLWDCADAGCTSGTLRSTTGVAAKQVNAMRLRPDGRALLLTQSQGGTPAMVACSDANCSSAPGRDLSGCDNVAAAQLAQRPDGTTVVACTTGTNQDYALALHDCAAESCWEGSTRPLLPAGRAGFTVAVAVRTDDRPVIAYYDQANGDVGLYVCASPGCP